MRIDIPTVILLLGTSSFASAWALWYLRWQSSSKWGLFPLALGFATLGTASLFVGIGLYQLVPKAIWANISLLGSTAGFMTILIGFRALNYGRIRRYVIACTLILGALAISSLCTNLWAVDQLRGTLYLCMGMWCNGLAAYKIARKYRTEPLPSRIPLAICLALEALVFLEMLVVAVNNGFFRGHLSWGFTIQMLLHFLTTIFIYGLVRDRLEKVLRNASEIDVLTRVGNRRWFENNAPLHPARKDALIIFDIDRFKLINDEHGHPVGDEVLRMVAAEITRLHRTNDLFARYGGEEFILFLDEVERSELIHIAERLRNGVQNLRFPAQGQTFQITISLGLAWNNGSFHSLTEMTAAADQALYEAKNKGRNTLALYRAEEPPLSYPEKTSPQA
jgi:diguanylate cyclase (GGDEF)-like protein